MHMDGDCWFAQVGYLFLVHATCLLSGLKVFPVTPLACTQVDRERFPSWRGFPIAVVQNGMLAGQLGRAGQEQGINKKQERCLQAASVLAVLERLSHQSKNASLAPPVFPLPCRLLFLPYRCTRACGRAVRCGAVRPCMCSCADACVLARACVDACVRAAAVTTNYRVREMGLQKMGEPVLLSRLVPACKFAGSDMTRYRAASRAWHQVCVGVRACVHAYACGGGQARACVHADACMQAGRLQVRAQTGRRVRACMRRCGRLRRRRRKTRTFDF